MTDQIDPNMLYLNGTIDPDNPNRPLIFWGYMKKHGTITVQQARDRALLLYKITAIAETEVLVAEKMAKDINSTDKNPSKDFEERFYQCLQMTCSARPELPDGITIAFHTKTKQPLIDMDWYGSSILQDVDTIRDHANCLIQVAESAQSDRWFYSFLGNTMGLQIDEVKMLLADFAKWRQTQELEESLNIDVEAISTKEKLALALVASGAPSEMIEKAKQGYYDDYESELAAPIVQLVADLQAAGLEELRQKAIDGEFDGTPEESEAWFEREGKHHMPPEMWSTFGYNPNKRHKPKGFGS